jgi:hypothetical protein
MSVSDEPSRACSSPVSSPAVPDTGDSDSECDSCNKYAPRELPHALFDCSYGADGKLSSATCSLPGCTWSANRSGLMTTSLWRHLASRNHKQPFSHEKALRTFIVQRLGYLPRSWQFERQVWREVVVQESSSFPFGDAACSGPYLD